MHAGRRAHDAQGPRLHAGGRGRAAAVARSCPRRRRRAGDGALAGTCLPRCRHPVADVSTAIGSTYIQRLGLGQHAAGRQQHGRTAAATTNATRGRAGPAPRRGRKDDDLTGELAWSVRGRAGSRRSALELPGDGAQRSQRGAQFRHRGTDLGRPRRPPSSGARLSAIGRSTVPIARSKALHGVARAVQGLRPLHLHQPVGGADHARRLGERGAGVAAGLGDLAQRGVEVLALRREVRRWPAPGCRACARSKPRCRPRTARAPAPAGR